MNKQCEYCGLQSLSLRRCTGCFKAYYCSKNCQKADWYKRHIRLCKQDEKEAGKTPGDGATGNDSPDTLKTFCRSTDRLTGKLQFLNLSKVDSFTLLKTCCVVCRKTDDIKTCTRCRQIKYCSRSCQRQDWPKHKQACKVAAKLRTRMPPNLNLRPGVLPPWAIGDGPAGEVDENYLEVDLNYKATTRIESLDKAKAFTKLHFPFHNIIDDIGKISEEFFGSFRPGGTNSVLVAFISRYHDHVVRHCIYIGDKKGAEIYVAFYLDFDNPLPYFNWSDVVPGKYICIEDPYIHFFLDGAVGIRVDEAKNVRILSL